MTNFVHAALNFLDMKRATESKPSNEIIDIQTSEQLWEWAMPN